MSLLTYIVIVKYCIIQFVNSDIHNLLPINCMKNEKSTIYILLYRNILFYFIILNDNAYVYSIILV